MKTTPSGRGKKTIHNLNFKTIMNDKSPISMKTNSLVDHFTSWTFGIVVLAIGIINMGWGNDPGFGVLFVLLSFTYFPPSNVLFRKITSFGIPMLVKIILGIFILWAALGVGELLDKINLMIKDL